MSYKVSDIAYLKEYLKYAVEFEKAVYIWKMAMEKANEQMRNIHSERISLEGSTVSVQNQLTYLDNYKSTSEEQKKLKKYKRAYLIAIIIFAILESITILCGLAMLFIGGADLVTAVSLAMTIIFSFSIVNLLLTMPWYIFNKSKYKESLQKADAISRADRDRRKKLLLEAQNNNNQQALAKNKNLENVISQRQEEIFNAYRQARNNLSTLYSENILPAKYRSFNAVATMYEYLETGRCNTIQGHGGIYDTYEKDLQMGLVIQNLENINATLSRIEANQQLLYNELRQANSTLQKINSSLEDVKKTNAQIAHNTAISAEANRQTAAAAQWLTWRAWARGF